MVFLGELWLILLVCTRRWGLWYEGVFFFWGEKEVWGSCFRGVVGTAGFCFLSFLGMVEWS